MAGQGARRPREVPCRALPRRGRGTVLRGRARLLLPARRHPGPRCRLRGRRPDRRPPRHPPLVRHGQRPGLRRHPLLPARGRVDRRVQRLTDREPVPLPGRTGRVMITNVVVDIEGTTSSLAYVREHVFGFASRRLADWIAVNRGRPEAAAVLAETRLLAGRPDASEDDCVEILLSWARQDAKVAALKDAQGHIWREALRAGELEAHFYPDVAPALRR